MSSEERGVSSPCGVLNPDGALPLFIGEGDRLGGEGVLKSNSLIVFTVRRVFCTPSPLRGPLPL